MDNNTSTLNKHGEKLSEIAENLTQMHFSYKVKERSGKKYWKNRVADFEQYMRISTDYYTHARATIALIDKEESDRFLLLMAKMQQDKTALAKTIKEIATNPSIMDSRDRQQSKWSKDVKERLIQQSDQCLQHEKKMNQTFRDFYEKNFAKTLTKD